MMPAREGARRVTPGTRLRREISAGPLRAVGEDRHERHERHERHGGDPVRGQQTARLLLNTIH